MEDLSHWDFAEHFKAKEIAELIVGIPPEKNTNLFSVMGEEAQYVAKITPILRRMERSYMAAGNLLNAAATWGENAKEGLELFPAEAPNLESEPMRRVRGTVSGYGLSMFEQDVPAFEHAYFDRDEVRRWLTAIGMPSVYSFSKEAASTPATRTSFQSFLSEHQGDFTGLDEWLRSFGLNHRRSATALRLAMEKMDGFPPLYAQEGPSGTQSPIALDLDAAAGIWARILIEMLTAELPDVIADAAGQEVWVHHLYVRDADCGSFLARAGLPMGELAGLKGGVVARGKLDLIAAEKQMERAQAPAPLASRDSTQAQVNEPERSLSARERDGLLRIIGALLSFISGDIPNVDRHPDLTTEAELIRILDQHFDGFEGLSASNMSRKFPLAKRLLRD